MSELISSARQCLNNAYWFHHSHNINGPRQYAVYQHRDGIYHDKNSRVDKKKEEVEEEEEEEKKKMMMMINDEEERKKTNERKTKASKEKK